MTSPAAEAFRVDDGNRLRASSRLYVQRPAVHVESRI